MPNPAGRAIALFVLLLTAAGTSVSAATNDFYLNLLRRGISNYEAAQYEAAVRELDVAAFGLIESIDHFETAKTYSAIANDRLGRTTEARAAAQRVLAAERVQRRFSQMTLPPEVRTAFLAVARKVLSAAEVAALSRQNAPVPPAAQSQPRTAQVSTPSTPNKPQPQVATQPPPVTTQPQIVPAPQNSSATKPEPTPQIVPPDPKPVVPDPKPLPPPVETPRKIEETIVEFPAQPEPAKPQPKVEPPPPVKVDPPVKVEPPKVEPPKPTPAKPATQPASGDVATRIASADKLLAQNNLLEARAIYRGLLDVQSLDHATLLTVGEGLYRARDFAGAVIAFERAGTLTNGEAPYRYYLAVALYETGSYKKAKRELAAALPHIEITQSVTRYRAKIEGAID